MRYTELYFGILFITFVQFSNSQDVPQPVDYPIENCRIFGDSLNTGGFRYHVSGTIILPHPGYQVGSVENEVVDSKANVTVNLILDESNVFPQVEVKRFFYSDFETQSEIVPVQNPSPTRICGNEDSNTTLQQLLVHVISNKAPITNMSQLQPSVDVYPKAVESNDPIRISVSGEFPTAAYKILHKSVSVTGQLISVSTVVDQDEVGADVLTPFSEHFWVNPLPAGDYQLQWIINGEVAVAQSIHIDEQDEVINSYQARFSVPPTVGASTWLPVNISSVLPTEYHRFTGSNVLVNYNGQWNIFVHDYTSKVWTLSQNSPGIPTVHSGNVDNFASYDQEIYLRGKINGEHIPPMRVIIGDAPVYPNLQDDWISFRIGTPISSDQESFIKIDSDGNFAMMNSDQETAELHTGVLPVEQMERLSNLFEASNFIELPPQTGNNNWDGYIIAYKNIGVFVDVDAKQQASAELQNIIQTMEGLLISELQTSHIEPELWKLY